eukprot:SAG25_NODE_11272_length_309_cov_0.652381_1_plen_38_part_10
MDGRGGRGCTGTAPAPRRHLTGTALALTDPETAQLDVR